MKNIAIICEYNPMHKGHIEQIRQIKEHFPDSNIIALMSGSFVQRGHAAILDKFSRAQIAIENGIDLVLEMPTIVSLQSADYFSYYSVKILDKLGVLDYLSFGIECEDAEKFIQTEEILAKEADSIDKLTKEYISNGLSYKQAYQLAVKESIPSIDDNFFKANNTLALGYCKALRRLNSNIDILPIHRKSADYNSDSLSNHPFQSATAIRKLMRAGEKYSKFVADRVEELYIDEKINEIEDYSQLFYYQAIVQGKNPDNIAGYENGMLNLLINNFEGSIVDAINKSHNKRYTISRLRRFVINYLLDITSDLVNSVDQISYIRPLAFNNKSRTLLNEIKEKSQMKILIKLADSIKLSDSDQKIIEIDKQAYLLRNLSQVDKNYRDYSNQPFME